MLFEWKYVKMRSIAFCNNFTLRIKMCNFHQLYHAKKLHSEKKNTKSDDCILIVTNLEGEFQI